MTKKNSERYSTPTPCTAAVVSDLQERLRVQSEALNAKSLAMDTLRYQLNVKLEEQKSRLLKLARRVDTLRREKEAVRVEVVGVQAGAQQLDTDNCTKEFFVNLKMYRCPLSSLHCHRIPTGKLKDRHLLLSPLQVRFLLRISVLLSSGKIQIITYNFNLEFQL